MKVSCVLTTLVAAALPLAAWPAAAAPASWSAGSEARLDYMISDVYRLDDPTQTPVAWEPDSLIVTGFDDRPFVSTTAFVSLPSPASGRAKQTNTSSPLWFENASTEFVFVIEFVASIFANTEIFSDDDLSDECVFGRGSARAEGAISGFSSAPAASVVVSTTTDNQPTSCDLTYYNDEIEYFVEVVTLAPGERSQTIHLIASAEVAVVPLPASAALLVGAVGAMAAALGGRRRRGLASG